MALNHICNGNILDFKNIGDDIKSGQPVIIGSFLGVALTDINKDETGSVSMQGVYNIKKASEVFNIGDKLYWSATNELTKTVCDIYAGYAFKYASGSDSFVALKLAG